MKTYRQKGDNIDYPNVSGSTMASGTPYLIGTNVIAIPVADILTATTGAVAVDGATFTVPKVTGRAWTVGSILFWDISASKFDVVAGTPATGDIVGCAMVSEPAASADTTGGAKLLPGNGTVT